MPTVVSTFSPWFTERSLSSKEPTVRELLYAAVFPEDPIADWSKAQLAAIAEKYKKILAVYDEAWRRHRGEPVIQRQDNQIVKFNKRGPYQVAAFTRRGNAYEFARKLIAKGYDVTVELDVSGMQGLYKVFSNIRPKDMTIEVQTAEVRMLGSPFTGRVTTGAVLYDNTASGGAGGAGAAGVCTVYNGSTGKGAVYGGGSGCTRTTAQIVEHIEKIANHLQKRGWAYNRTDAIARAWEENPELIAEYDEAYRREEGWHRW